MELYSAVYNYCTATRAPGKGVGKGSTGGANFVGEELYTRLHEFMVSHMGTVQKGLEGLMDENLLRFYHKEWLRFTSALKYINHMFSYLNRHWIKREAEDGKREVYEVSILGLVVWRDFLFRDMKPRITKAVLDLIEKDRNDEVVDVGLIAGVIDCYVKLGLNRERPKEVTLDVYKEDFETPCLEATRDYYTKESTLFIAENSVSDYLKKVQARLQQEARRGSQFFHSSSQFALMNVCEKVMIEKHVEALQNEFMQFLKGDKIEDLTNMYALLSRVQNALDPLKALCEKHIHSVGLAELETISKEQVKPQIYVDAVLKTWRKYSDLVKAAFQNDAGFVAALDKACRRFLNNNAITQMLGGGGEDGSSKSPELLARTCDQLLKKGAKGTTETDVERILDDIVTVFKYIEDKDVFLFFFSKMMAKRLINEASASEDMEATFISKLKSVSGYEYTTKLQRMIQDVGTSRELNAKFVAQQESKQSLDVSVMVLATGSWPLGGPSCEFTIPSVVAQQQALFETFYSEQHSGRKLTWLPQLSKGELRTYYMSKSYTLQCSAYQIGVLLMFEDKDKLSMEQISIGTQLTESALKQTMYALVKTRTLIMDPAPESVSEPVIPDEAAFTLNRKFASKRLKVNINISSKGASKKESAQVNKELNEDRKLAIQACIVRIMKARKTLQHAQLISEVVTQLTQRFKPKIPLIKKCIDILIEKEYLERSDGRKEQYTYKA